MRQYSYYVYIIANRRRSTFYIGMTNNLLRRIDEHRRGVFDGFTKRYCIKHLVYFEETDDVTAAIAREKQLKNWHRPWKKNLIRSMNPRMVDLAAGWYDAETGDPETILKQVQDKVQDDNSIVLFYLSCRP